MDCSYSWRVKLTEYGYCITNKATGEETGIFIRVLA